ncbi:hypothetical protein Q7P37_007679 [Cladosporium fusiforme]
MSTVYPNYEALMAVRPEAPAGAISLEFLRLRWFLQNDNPCSAITIIQDPSVASSAQGPYSPAHPISQLPLTTTPVSAITVSVGILDEYANKWISVHREHAEPEDSPDHDGERFDVEGRVEYCCHQERPGPGPRVEVVAEPGHFVTIGQFVGIVHPWLRGLDNQLRAAKGVQSCWPLDPAVDMYVWPTSWSPLRVSGREGQTAQNRAYEWAQLARTAASTLRLRNEACA